MSDAQTRTLTDVLGGNVPLRANRGLLDRLRRDDRGFISLALAPGLRLGSGAIHAMHEVITKHTASGQNLDLYVSGLGQGGGHCWRLVSMVREHFAHLRVIVPFKTSPGASQIALGADEIEMSSAACLTAPNAAFEFDEDDPAREVLLAHAGLIERAARDAACTLPEGGARRLARVALQLARRTAYQRNVCRRCLQSHQAPLEGSALDAVLDALEDATLGGDLPITRRDVERFGLSVVRPEGERWHAMLDLYEYYRHMFGVEGDLNVDHQHFSVGYDGFIDAPGHRRVLLRITRTDERGRALPDRAPLYRWVTPHGGELVLDQELTL